MPADRNDLPLLIFSAALVVVAGLVVAGAIWLATDSSGGAPKDYEPFDAGRAESIHESLDEGGPYFVPDPFEGDRSILLALEDDEIVALSVNKPGDPDCHVRWRGSVDSFVDCDDDELRSEQLDRYLTSIPGAGDQEGSLLVDLRALLPAPQPITAGAS